MKGPHIHWLDDMPLTLVLIAATDTRCAGMRSAGRSFRPYAHGVNRQRVPYLSHLILRRLHSVGPRDA